MCHGHQTNPALTNDSFLVPFDEDDKDKSVWFLDHDYLENMYGMFKKVNGKASRLSLTMYKQFRFL